jgi:hypothetical protein
MRAIFANCGSKTTLSVGLAAPTSAPTCCAIGAKPAASAAKKRPTPISPTHSRRLPLPEFFYSAAGKAEFDGQLVDVIAEGLPIDRGQAVVVTTARGNRVLVRAVEA